MTDVELAVRFFLQLAVILLACRLVGLLGRLAGQTQVVSEMITGILLGPSLFGLLLPQAQQWLFPKTVTIAQAGGEVTITHPSMSILYVVSQLGLVLYMFLVGLEFDLHLLKGRTKNAMAVSLSGIALPLALGAAFSFFLSAQGGFYGEGVTPMIGALYLGASMCITAFPTLARIIYEQNISKTSIGTLALAAGAIDDALAWCLLAVVLAFLKGSLGIAVWAIGGGLGFAVLMVLFGRKALSGLERWTQREGKLTPHIAITVFVILMVGAWYTDAIGIYSVFGAFVVGACMPRGLMAKQMHEQIMHVTSSLLLPTFFVYSGLNTQVSLLNSPGLWGIAGILLVLAIAGKWGGCGLAARAVGESWRNASIIGVLMNARGLMELIILNIGLKQGVITPTLFTMMVLMAIVTTVMTSPLFTYLYHRRMPFGWHSVPKAS